MAWYNTTDGALVNGDTGILVEKIDRNGGTKAIVARGAFGIAVLKQGSAASIDTAFDNIKTSLSAVTL